MSPADDEGALRPPATPIADAYWRRIGAALDRELVVSAIVVTYHTGPRLKECLRILRADTDVSELIIVDNGNPPSTRDWLQAFCDAAPKARLIRAPRNLGFAAGCNLGVRSATGARLLFINPDALLRVGSVAALEAAALCLREPWIVGGRLYYPDGSEQRGARRDTLTLWSACVSFLGLSRFEHIHSAFRDVHRHRDPVPDRPTPSAVVSGALMYLSRKGFERLGGFDEAYFLHVEDIDICRRARETWRGDVVFAPDAGALHYGSTSAAPLAAVERAKARGLGIYFKKFAAKKSDRLMAFLFAPVFERLLATRVQLINLRASSPFRRTHT